MPAPESGVLPLEDVCLPQQAVRDPCLPVLKRVKSDHVHPLRAHCFAKSRTRFTQEQLDGVRNLPASSATYVYQMELDRKDTLKRHRLSKAIKFDKPLAAGLLAKGLCLHRLCVPTYFAYLCERVSSRLRASEARGCCICSAGRRQC